LGVDNPEGEAVRLRDSLEQVAAVPVSLGKADLPLNLPLLEPHCLSALTIDIIHAAASVEKMIEIRIHNNHQPTHPKDLIPKHVTVDSQFPSLEPKLKFLETKLRSQETTRLMMVLGQP
jgi:hypothetical protein